MLRWIPRRSFTFVATVILALSLTGPTLETVGPAGASGFVPYQLVSKAFTEVLGRTPNASDWNTWALGYWGGQSGCTAPSVVGFIQQFTGAAAAELNTHNYNAAQLAIIAFRLVLNRDPGPGAGFTNFINFVATHGGGSAGFIAVVNNLMNQPEFASLLANSICSGNVDYGFGTSQAIDPNNPTGAGSVGGQPYGVSDRTAALQTLLNTGTQVTLVPGTVYGVSAPLDVPTGVKLTTAGGPAPSGYLNQARIVKLPSFPKGGDDPMIRLEGTAQLDNVWVDGQDGVFGRTPETGIGGQSVEARDVTTSVPIQATIDDDRIDNTSSKVAITVWGPGDGIGSDTAACGATNVNLNLITGYRSVHSSALQDGIQTWCGSTTIAFNEIVDETDAPVVMFAGNGKNQGSSVQFNEILAAGNSSFYGIVLDPLLGNAGSRMCTHSAAHGDEGTFANNPVTPANYSKTYTNALVQDNLLFTSPATFMDVVLSIGTHELQSSCEHPKQGPNGPTGNNALGPVTVAGNTSGNELTRAQIGIYVGGLFDAHVDSANAFPHVVSPGGNCPLKAAFVVVSGNGSTYPNYAAGLVTTVPYTPDSTGVDDGCNLGF